ncbi:MAG: TonB-dependent receptor [Verrucomicrobia bacterium]|nr:TonB-dependent receptor [Verrucomicrobiota bacterium]
MNRFLLLVALSPAALSGIASAATISGTVRNESTRAHLEGAEVTLIESGVTVVTDRSGSFQLRGVPPGRQRLVFRYAGLDPQETTVEVSEERPPAPLAIGLTSAVYQLDAFVVTTDREGNAAAITAQKKAPNLATIIATDAYGNIADGNIGNLVQRLSGVDQTRSNGDIIGFGVRGVPQTLSTVSVDGAVLSAANGGSGSIGDRAYPIDNLPAELVQTVRLTKAPTPDMPADSLGGNVDLVTKSALEVAGRRISYRVGLNNNLYRGNTAWTPTASLTFLDTFGRERKLGVAITGSHSEATNTRDRLQNTLAFAPDTAVIVNTRLRLLDDIVERVRSGGSAKLDWRPADNLTLSLDAIVTRTTYALDRSDYRLSGINRVADYARVSREAIFAGTVARTTSNQTASLAPGFTDAFQEVLNATNQYLIADETRANGMYKIGFRTHWRRDDGWLELRASHNASKSDYFLHQIFTTAGGGFGYSLDTTQHRNRPRVTQLYGPTVFAGADLSRYTAQYLFTPTNVHDVTDEVRADWHRDFAGSRLPWSLQAGLAYRGKDYRTLANNRTFNFVGSDGVAGRNAATGLNDDNLAQFYRGPSNAMFDGYYPRFDTLVVGRAAALFASQRNQFVQLATDVTLPEARLEEDVTAAYAMGQTRLGRFSVLAGLRAERTDVEATGSLRLNNAPVFALTTREARYTQWFPGTHLRYELTPQFLVRASWSTGVGRPAISQQLPTTTINTNATTGLGTVNANNTNLRPMFSQNYDLGLQYYFKGVGMVAVGGFQKKIKDFINSRRTLVGAGPGNGFGGQYEGYDLVTQENLSSAEIRGMEFDYSQVLTFLPRALQGSSVFGNFTWMETAGQFPDGSSSLPGFRPMLANAGVVVKYQRGLVRVSYKYQSGGLVSFNADPTLRTYSTEDRTVDLNLQYQATPRFTFFIDVINLFDAAPKTYVIKPRFILTDEFNGTRLNVGVSGRL